MFQIVKNIMKSITNIPNYRSKKDKAKKWSKMPTETHKKKFAENIFLFLFVEHLTYEQITRYHISIDILSICTFEFIHILQPNCCP